MSTTTIWNVLTDSIQDINIKRGIKIPMIQRDYAQGRKNVKASEIRKVFLDNLFKGINGVIKNNHHPIELDFIYGYIDSEAFVPLDGQQRLTTLYLLHWYFAFKEGQLEEFSVPFSRFTYQTRKSSEEFLSNLSLKISAEDHSKIFNDDFTFETVIKDKNWYFLSWEYDLTIQSIITMLDEIHKVFNLSQIHFSDLINENRPCVVFNFLNVEKFGLSDNLYIKMNARGKPLNNFENLKAELGRFIERSAFNEIDGYFIEHSSGVKLVTVEQYFVTKIDTIWTDYFWKIKDIKTKEFDDKLLNLLAFIALNEVAKKNYKEFDFCLKTLGNNETQLSFYQFTNLNLLTKESIISYIEILDLLVNKEETIVSYLEETDFLNKPIIIQQSFKNSFGPLYESRVLFHSIFKFLVSNKNALSPIELSRWDRLIRNLVKNSIYNDSNDFRESIISIDNILDVYDGDIYYTFLNLEIKGFDTQQIKEEKLKIQLIENSPSWEEFINEAESHPYLNGQIIPLLSFSGVYDIYLSDNLNKEAIQEKDFLNKATSYYFKFKALFKNDGIENFENDLFRRALLVKGDYLLYSTNWSFLINGNHRDISWKRLLKETGNRNQKSDYFIKRSKYLKELFDDIDLKDPKNSLEKIIETHNCTNWRADFIDNPLLMQLSYKHYIKYYDNNSDIYVLRKSKYNKKADPEIKSVLLKQSLIKKGYSENEIELGYIETLNQFGIIRIKKHKPKVVFYKADKEYLIRRKGHSDKFFKDQNSIAEYLLKKY